VGHPFGGSLKSATFVLLVLYSFAVPWEYSLDLGEPLGNVARILGLLVLLVAVPAVLRKRGVRRLGGLHWLVLALYLYFVGTAFWTIDPESTVEKIRAYFQVMMSVWLVWEFAETPVQLRWLLRAFVAGCWVLAVLTFVNFLGLTSAGADAVEQIRFVAEGQDPNDVARFLDLGFPLAALLFATERRWLARLLALGYLPGGLLAVLLTASRGGFSAAIVSLVGSALLLVCWRPRVGLALLAGMAAAGSLAFMLVPQESLDRLATIPEQLGSSDLNDRFNIWVAGFHAFTQAPWLGYGAGTYAAASGLALGDTAHNTVMAVLVTGGLVAIAMFIGIVTLAGWAVFRTPGLLRIALITVLVAWVITSMVGSVEENRTTWLLFGVMAVAGRLATEQRDLIGAVFSADSPKEVTAVLCAVQ
jgi:O-antigen ligase